MKISFTFVVLFVSILSPGQTVLVFDSIQPGQVVLTDYSIYMNADKFVKADYQGNIHWTDTGLIYGQIRVAGSFIYGFKGGEVFKWDTAGIAIWHVQIDQAVCSASVQNSIVDLVLNNNRIFLLLSEYVTGYPAVVTLDTSGNVINVSCMLQCQGCIFIDAVPSLSGGIWITGVDGGTAHYGFSLKTDSSGNIINGNSHSFGNGPMNWVNGMIDRPSGHCFINQAGLNAEIHFQSDDGNLCNTHTYTDISFEAFDIAPDGSFFVQATDFNGDHLLKLDSSGNVVIVRSWNNAVLNYYQLELEHYAQVKYRNDSIYVSCRIQGKPAILVFDTLLNTLCYMPDTTRQVQSNVGVNFPVTSTAGIQDATSVSFVQVSSHTMSPPSGFNLCLNVPVHNPETWPEIKIYPNPCAERVYIEFDKPCSAEAVLYDMTGRVVDFAQLRATTNSTFSLSLENIRSGIYILRLNIEGGSFQSKLLVHH